MQPVGQDACHAPSSPPLNVPKSYSAHATHMALAIVGTVARRSHWGHSMLTTTL